MKNTTRDELAATFATLEAAARSDAAADDALDRVYDLASLVRLTQREIVRLSELEHALAQATPAAAGRLRVIGDAAALCAAVVLTAAAGSVVTGPAREVR